MSNPGYIKQALNTIIELRDDLSPYLLHLTRDYGGFSAKENLISILSSKQVEARNIDCYRKAEVLNVAHDEFNTVSFTETPLNQIVNLVNIPFKRDVKLEEYGIAFRREYLIERKVAPVTYVYNKEQKDFWDSLINMYISNINPLPFNLTQDSLCNIISLLKVINEKYDFHWEREWKVRKNFNFSIYDCYYVITPNLEEAKYIFSKLNMNCLDFYIVKLDKRIRITKDRTTVEFGGKIEVSEVYDVSEYTDNPDIPLKHIEGTIDILDVF